MAEPGSVMAITAVAYLIGEAVKSAGLPGKWIPVICGAAGLALGIAGMYLVPTFPANDLLTAAAVGTVSGFAATGVDQTVRHFKKEEQK